MEEINQVVQNPALAQVVQIVQDNVAYAPFILFGLLMLAGINVPIPEDGMMFIAAVLASKYPEHLLSLFIAVYMGAYLSDLVCYGLGRFLGHKLFEIRFFANMVSRERVAKIHNFYERYGVITILVGRFIPFGVRNGLFLTAGLGEMNFVKFALADLAACTITTSIYFSLYFHFGNAVIDYVKESNKLLFAAAVVGVAFYFWSQRKKKQESAS